MCDFKKFAPSCECNLLDTTYKLYECDEDVSNHLYSLKSSGIKTTSENVSCPEYLVLLYRAGLFVIDKHLFLLKICDNHRKRLGVQWRRPQRTCAYPGHEGNAKADRGASPTLCKEVWLQTGQTLPIGSALCKKCMVKHKKEVNHEEEIGMIGHIAEDLKELQSIEAPVAPQHSKEITERIFTVNEIMENYPQKNSTQEVEASKEIHHDSENHDTEVSEHDIDANVPRDYRMDKMGSGVSQNGSSPSQPKGTSDGPRPPRDPYQQLNNVLSEYKDGKKSLSVDDVKALQEFIQHHQKDGSSQSTHGLITMKQQLSSFEKQRQDILNKISEVAGARLKSNNPAIADLSDQNRPSKLAEKFSELYDNEWTDAAEELKQTIKFPKETSEEEMDIVVIKFLYNFAKVTYEECKKKAAEQLKHVKDAVSFHNENVGEMAIELDRKCRDFIRRHCEITLSQALKILPYKVIKDQTTAEEELGIAVNQLENCKHANDFFKLCTRLCWMMALQDPPVYMVTSTDSMEMYRAYTRSGDLIEYVVWPSLLLHEDGPLLYKGVAQFKKRDGKKEKENSEVKSVVDNDKTVHAEDPIYANVDNSDNNKDSIKNGTVKTQTKTKPGDNSSGGPHVTKIDVK